MGSRWHSDHSARRSRRIISSVNLAGPRLVSTSCCISDRRKACVRLDVSPSLPMHRSGTFDPTCPSQPTQARTPRPLSVGSRGGSSCQGRAAVERCTDRAQKTSPAESNTSRRRSGASPWLAQDRHSTKDAERVAAPDSSLRKRRSPPAARARRALPRSARPGLRGLAVKKG